jgi:hypothetical protein
MTLHATREGQKIQIHGNIGVDVTVRSSQVHEITINEDARHTEYFHGQLGKLLAEAKAEREHTEAAGTAGA